MGPDFVLLSERNCCSAPAKDTAPWRQLALASALTALALLALAPIPATGFADHPVTRVVRSLAEHIGVRETAATPPVTAAPVVVEGTALTSAEVSLQSWAFLWPSPAHQPAGFELASTRFFPQPLTADSGGVFVLTYARETGSAVVVYQERAGGADFSAASGSAEDVQLADGTGATFVNGTWQEVRRRPRLARRRRADPNLRPRRRPHDHPVPRPRRRSPLALRPRKRHDARRSLTLARRNQANKHAAAQPSFPLIPSYRRNERRHLRPNVAERLQASTTRSPSHNAPSRSS